VAPAAGDGSVTGVPDYPAVLTPVNHVEPVPRRLRATLGHATVFDTTHALYVWEWPNYPQYYVPVSDVDSAVLVAEGQTEESPRGPVELYALRVGDICRRRAARFLPLSPDPRLHNTVRFEWTALDAWYEEDEQVFVHPRNPYSRVDALRSTRPVRVELEGTLLGQSSSPVMVFETGLPTRYYLPPTEIDFTHLMASATVTACPYKGTTSGYWSVQIGPDLHDDLAWSYDFPTRELLPIAGLVAFYNEYVDIWVDGIALDRPRTHFSRPSQ